MATGRMTLKNTRVYVDGYDLSGYARSIGPLDWSYGEVDLTAPMGDAIKGILPGQPNITVGTLNTVLDPTATVGPVARLGTAGQMRAVMVAIGGIAAPVKGKPVFCGKWQQTAFQYNDDGGASVLNIPFGDWDANSLIAYSVPWGDLLHAKAAETAVNAGAGVESLTGAATAFGGYMMYQVFACAGGAKTGVIKVQDSIDDTDGDYADIAPVSLTTGVLDFTNPQAGIIAIPNTATIRRYTRWQIVLTTMTSCTFALAFVRNYRSL